MTRLGRATIYMGGGLIMLICLIITGALHYVPGKNAKMGVGILLLVQTLVNMASIGTSSNSHEGWAKLTLIQDQPVIRLLRRPHQVD
jgi:hypothetical protein